MSVFQIRACQAHAALPHCERVPQRREGSASATGERIASPVACATVPGQVMPSAMKKPSGWGSGADYGLPEIRTGRSSSGDSVWRWTTRQTTPWLPAPRDSREQWNASSRLSRPRP